eukprot:evm.model.scf_76.12 EVM.evm.TU.scf_76.12   scf_76:86733-89268(-)
MDEGEDMDAIRSHAATPENQVFEAQMAFGQIYERHSDVQKRVWLIRHAESMANAALDGSDMRDPPLSEVGREQALVLRQDLANKLASVDPRDVLWVVSPLRRAIETFLEACPWQEELQQNLLSVEVSSAVAEKRQGKNGMGSSEAQLCKDYPALSKSLDGLGGCWWVRKLQEPDPAFGDRVSKFRLWLRHQTVPVIIVFSHYSFIDRLTGSVATLQNAEMVQVFV